MKQISPELGFLVWITRKNCASNGTKHCFPAICSHVGPSTTRLRRRYCFYEKSFGHLLRPHSFSRKLTRIVGIRLALFPKGFLKVSSYTHTRMNTFHVGHIRRKSRFGRNWKNCIEINTLLPVVFGFFNFRPTCLHSTLLIFGHIY